VNVDPHSGVDELARRVESLEDRLARLEDRLAGGDGVRSAETGALIAEPASDHRERQAQPSAAARPVELLPLYGRTLLIFAGAFLIRALTEGGALPDRAGAWIGIAYALVLLWLADREAPSGRTSATFFGLAGIGIAFPLVWEATSRFAFLSPRGGAVALALLGAASLAVVSRRRLHMLAWLVAAGGGGAALSLAMSTREWGTYVLELLLLSAALLFVAPRRGWLGLQWFAVAAAVGSLALMTVTLLITPEERVAGLFSAGVLLSLQLGWVLTYFGLLAYRTLGGREEVGARDAALALATLAAGFGGALAITRAGFVPELPLGFFSLVLAAGGYAVSFAFVDRRMSRANFAFYTTFALLVTLVASGSLLHGGALALLLAVLGLATGALGSLKSRATLTVHSAVYLIGALAASGGLKAIADAFGTGQPPAMAWLTLPTLLALLVAVVDAWMPSSTEGRTWGWFSRVPRVVVEALVLVGASAVVVSFAATVVGSEAGGEDLAALAAVRTGALALAAIGAAWASRRPRWPEAVWLVYPLLVLGGLKLLAVDLPQGRPATLVLSFLFYGTALILAPRLARREPGGTAAS